MQCTNIGTDLLEGKFYFEKKMHFSLARPCCTGILGDCVLTSNDDCRRRRGIFHSRAHLCSQVNIKY
jgi:hypothetical protein